jgi:hypothetical protein
MIAFGHLLALSRVGCLGAAPVHAPGCVALLADRGAVRFALVINVRGAGGLLWRMRLPVQFIVVQQRSC